nr:hypothetical protein [uncultured bacterium]
MGASIRQRSLEWAAAGAICRAAAEHAVEIGVKVNVAVVDPGGNLLAFQRINGAFLHSISIAEDKAYCAVSFGFPTSQWKTIFGEAPELKDGLSLRPRLVTLGGGVPIVEDGQVIGGVGVSGASEEQDEACAHAGIRAVGLEPG